MGPSWVPLLPIPQVGVGLDGAVCWAAPVTMDECCEYLQYNLNFLFKIPPMHYIARMTCSTHDVYDT